MGDSLGPADRRRSNTWVSHIALDNKHYQANKRNRHCRVHNRVYTFLRNFLGYRDWKGISAVTNTHATYLPQRPLRRAKPYALLLKATSLVMKMTFCRE